MKMRYTQFILTACILFFSKSISAQDKDLSKAEVSLKLLNDMILNAQNDSARSLLNQNFEETLYRTLELNGSFDYPFDSLKTLAKIVSPDKKFRIFNWNLPQGNGTNIYFGFIQMNPKGISGQTIYKLTDRSDSIPRPEKDLLSHDAWYGALYYQIVLTTHSGHTFYTLLGWDALNSMLSQKIIEVLTFDKNEKPFFGARIFRNFGDDQLSRIFFKYSSAASMLLTYDEQYITLGRKWNASRKTFETETIKTKMIVCDELVPYDPQLEGQFEYYVPSSEVFNGFVFNNGCWTYYENVDVRNKSR